MNMIKIIVISIIVYNLIYEIYRKNKKFSFYLCYFVLTVLVVLISIFLWQIADSGGVSAEFISEISVFSKILSVVSICMIGGGLNAIAEYIVKLSKNKRLSRWQI